jgi:hypothetical protein
VLLADLLQAEICAKCDKKYYRDYEVPKKDSDEAEDESEDDEDSHLTGRSWYHFFEEEQTFSPAADLTDPQQRQRPGRLRRRVARHDRPFW